MAKTKAARATWQNRIVGSGVMPASEFLANPQNWRIHPKAQQNAMVGALNELGWIQEVIVNQQTGHVVDGHMRIEAALRQGDDTPVPVKFVELTADEEALALATLDPIGAMAAADREKLSALMDNIHTSEEGLAAMLTELAEREGIGRGGDAAEDPGAQIDKAAELQEKWGTATGQLWLVGEHRILCGDCTQAEDVQRLMVGEKANGVFTSPPYAEQRKKQYGGIPTDEYVAWWNTIQANVKTVMAEDGSFFLNIKPHTEDGERVLYVLDLVLSMKRKWGWCFIDELVWYKTGFPGAYSNRFMNEFEPVYWFTTNGGANMYLDTLTTDVFNKSPLVEQTESILHFGKTKRVKFRPKGEGVRHASDGVNKYIGGKTENPNSKNIDFAENRHAGMARPGNVIKVHVNTEKLAQAAVFPVGLPEFFIKAFSDKTDIWLDPFLGSGTTIVACQKLGRRGRGIEISPAYVAVALERLAGMGLTPELAP